MKKCPKCNSEVEDNFEVCWNCQYSFEEKKVLDASDFKLICPKCNAELESSLNYCPHCHYILKELNEEIGLEIQGPKNIDCLRCKVPLNFEGNYKFHEGARVGAIGTIFELFTNRESFDLYSCPNCGKVEFYLPGYN